MAQKLRKAVEAMESMMSSESVERSRKKAEHEIFAIKLGILREKRGLKQNEIKNFSQTSVSRLERRKDIKISTLADYLHGLDMGLEIRTYPKNKKINMEEEVLLRL
ncbi:MAG: XRE family transcriptional regulator [Treponema sp.]|nr:XRE family transcriptional regulator [Treponema sp.]